MRDGVVGGERVVDAALVDVVEVGRPANVGFGVEAVVADLSEPGIAEGLVASRPDVIFHLAAVV